MNAPVEQEGGEARAAEQLPARAAPRRPVRQTFTIEVRVVDDGARVLATRIAQLETGEAVVLRGWDDAQVLGFLRSRFAP